MKNRIIKGVAGSLVLVSILLSIYIHHYWLWVAAFVGANLLQSSFSQWCLLEDILIKIGVKD